MISRETCAGGTFICTRGDGDVDGLAAIGLTYESAGRSPDNNCLHVIAAQESRGGPRPRCVCYYCANDFRWPRHPALTDFRCSTRGVLQYYACYRLGIYIYTRTHSCILAQAQKASVVHIYIYIYIRGYGITSDYYSMWYTV